MTSHRKVGGAFIIGTTSDDTDRMVSLIESFNAEMSEQAGSGSFVVCVRNSEGWAKVETAEKLGAFQAGIMAASMAQAGAALVGVFVETETGIDGPQMAFGRPASLVASWVEDTGDKYRPLIDGAVNAVFVNAEQFRLTEQMLTPDGKETMH